MKHFNPWMRIGFDWWGLALDASAVVGLRMMKMAQGGTAAEDEAALMVREKIAAGVALQAKAMTGGLGMRPETAVRRTIAHYRGKVKANRRRLGSG